jgi:hypothetical protein
MLQLLVNVKARVVKSATRSGKESRKPANPKRFSQVGGASAKAIRVLPPNFPSVRLLCAGYSESLSCVVVADGEEAADRLKFFEPGRHDCCNPYNRWELGNR